jgi:hypothetical protein
MAEGMLKMVKGSRSGGGKNERKEDTKKRRKNNSKEPEVNDRLQRFC